MTDGQQNDEMQIALDEENVAINNAMRQYLEGRVVELNIKLQNALKENLSLQEQINERTPELHEDEVEA